MNSGFFRLKRSSFIAEQKKTTYGRFPMTLTPPKTLNSGPEKYVIANFQTEYHGESEKKSVFVHEVFEKCQIRLLEKPTLNLNQTSPFSL